MDALIGFLNNPFILTGLQLGFGLAIKKWAALEAWPNKLIPLFNGILAVLIKLAGPGTAEAGVFGLTGGGFLNLLLEAGAQTLLSTGIHSTSKNFFQNIFGIVSRKR